MTSQTEGAVDSDFDDAERDAEAQLKKNIASYPAGIEPGDIVIDLVEGRPLYVRERKGTAIDVFERESFDLTTYKAHPWLPVTPHDTVFECVFLPTKPSDIPAKKKSNTYSYPRGRLARVAVEWLYGSDTHRHAEQTIETLARVFENTGGSALQAVVNTAVNAYGEEWVDIALEVAGHDPDEYDRDVVVDFADVDDDGTVSDTEAQADAFVELIERLDERGAPDVVFDEVAEAIVHDFDPDVGDRVTPALPKKEREDDVDPKGSTGEDGEDDGSLGDFDDFDADE